MTRSMAAWAAAGALVAFVCALGVAVLVGTDALRASPVAQSQFTAWFVIAEALGGDFGGAEEQRYLSLGEPGKVVRLTPPPNVRITANGAETRARRVHDDGVVAARWGDGAETSDADREVHGEGLDAEPLVAPDARELFAEPLDFPRNDDRRQLRQLRHHRGERRRISVGGLLLRGLGLPARRVPTLMGGGLHSAADCSRPTDDRQKLSNIQPYHLYSLIQTKQCRQKTFWGLALHWKQYL